MVVIGFAGAAAACMWLFVALKQQSGQSGWAAPLLAVGGFVVAAASGLLAWLQVRQSSRSTAIEQVAPQVRREREAADRLRVHLGRQNRLRRMDDPATRALALRVHPAIDLLQPSVRATAVRPGAGHHAAGRRLLLRPRPDSPDVERIVDPDLPTFVDRDKDPPERRIPLDAHARLHARRADDLARLRAGGSRCAEHDEREHQRHGLPEEGRANVSRGDGLCGVGAAQSASRHVYFVRQLIRMGPHASAEPSSYSARAESKVEPAAAGAESPPNGRKVPAYTPSV